ncbi:tegument protein UL51 [Gallid alphaherpesvirus 1]|uniref:Tegument protein UL51 n=1 Tax=Infectious laryngotracheitis virus TaxID=10386 RepID=L7SXU1_ILTV|nr:tegument protein UL51 [Gallid alphaherpesvirus 1]AGC23119.1 tegument protein UL51 [Gallid alphaherpesvirus 1]ATD84194.1 tegument protein UL51 [Gallid alphaherpesvirus 1]ATD84274.1 tegument protein UL51 [Gallid alphaherpesvirus 1]ATD84352.1 tegument protein UL51 [Gallid alphaherpesvirus 1]
MWQLLKSVFCGRSNSESKYEALPTGRCLPVDDRKVQSAVKLIKIFIPNCLDVEDVIGSRDELNKLAQARQISRILAKSAAAMQIAKNMRCPRGAEAVLRQTIVDNGTVFRSLYSVLAYLYLSPGADTDGLLAQVTAQTADRTMMLGDMTVLTHAMHVDGMDRDHSSLELLRMGLVPNSDLKDPIELVPVIDKLPDKVLFPDPIPTLPVENPPMERTRPAKTRKELVAAS